MEQGGETLAEIILIGCIIYTAIIVVLLIGYALYHNLKNK